MDDSPRNRAGARRRTDHRRTRRAVRRDHPHNPPRHPGARGSGLSAFRRPRGRRRADTLETERPGAQGFDRGTHGLRIVRVVLQPHAGGIVVRYAVSRRRGKRVRKTVDGAHTAHAPVSRPAAPGYCDQAGSASPAARRNPAAAASHLTGPRSHPSFAPGADHLSLEIERTDESLSGAPLSARLRAGRPVSPRLRAGI